MSYNKLQELRNWYEREKRNGNIDETNIPTIEKEFAELSLRFEPGNNLDGLGALPVSTAKEYTKLWKEYDSDKLYEDYFKGEYRIYLPVKSDKIYVLTEFMDNPIYYRIKNFLDNISMDSREKGENIFYYLANKEDYVSGLATFVDYNAKEKKEQKIRIGKLLSKLKDYKDKELLDDFNADQARAARTKDNLLAVISRHPYDLAGMSTDRGWTSCMNIGSKRIITKSDKLTDFQKPGVNYPYVNDDIIVGTLIAYLIKENDKNIQHPLGRVLIKPMYSRIPGKLLDKSNIYLQRAGIVYGTVTKEFLEVVDKWINNYNKGKKGDFELPISLYKERIEKEIHLGGLSDYNAYNEDNINDKTEPEIVTPDANTESNEGYELEKIEVNDNSISQNAGQITTELEQLPSAQDVKNMPVIDGIKLRTFRNFLVKLKPGTKIFVKGAKGSGKSSMLVKMAEDLGLNGRVLYVLLEEDLQHGDVTERLQLMNVKSNYIDFLEINPVIDNAQAIRDKLLNYINSMKYKFIIIDSMNVLTDKGILTEKELIQIINEFRDDISFIIVAQYTKDGKYRGKSDWEYFVDTVINVDKGVATLEKHRGAPTGQEFQVFSSAQINNNGGYKFRKPPGFVKYIK